MFSTRAKKRREFVPNLVGVRRLTFDMERALKKRHLLQKKTNKRDLVLSVESSRSTPLTVDIKRDLYLSKEPYKSDVYFPEGKRKKGSHC